MNKVLVDLKEGIKEIIINDFQIKESISDETKLVGDGLCLDSMQIIMLITAIEEKLSFQTDAAILEKNNFDSIQMLAENILKLYGKSIDKNYEGD